MVNVVNVLQAIGFLSRIVSGNMVLQRSLGGTTVLLLGSMGLAMYRRVG